MTSKAIGLDVLHQFLADAPRNLERNILRQAVKAGAEVIADAARDMCRSPEVRTAIKVTSRSEPGIVSAKVQVKGDGAYIAPWLEYGTDPHLITVDPMQADGRTVRRINTLMKKGVLAINGRPIGTTVHHPGAQPYPFMRPAADQQEGAAVQAMGLTIAQRATKAGFTAQPMVEELDE